MSETKNGNRQLVLEAIRVAQGTWCMWEPGQTTMVACSGGPDSICLLHAMHQLKDKQGIDVVVGHVDHCLRDDSFLDAEFVTEFARRLGVRSRVQKVEVKGTGEEAARLARYDALHGMADELNAGVIATAHTADDQAETLIMRLIRGTGPRGMGGIRAKRGCIVRPLLGVTRSEIERYLEVLGLVCRHDPTNEEMDPFRNRVRHVLMPAFKTENPNIVESMGRLAFNSQEEEAALERLLEDHSGGFSRRISLPGGRIAVLFDTKVLPKARAARLGVLAYLARGAYEEVARHKGFQDVFSSEIEGVTGSGLNKEGWKTVKGGKQFERKHLLTLDRWLLSNPGTREVRKLSLPGDVVALTSQDRLAFCPSSLLPRETPHWRWEIEVGRKLSPTGFVVTETPECPDPMIPERGLRQTLVLRTWLNGDRVLTCGGHKKLQDYFVDKGIPAPLRRRIPLWEHPDTGDVFVPCHTEGLKFNLVTEMGLVKLSLDKESLESALCALFGTFGL